MVDKGEKVEALEEAVRLLESVKAAPRSLGELDFDDARVDGYVTTALTAARSALAAATERHDPENAR